MWSKQFGFYATYREINFSKFQYIKHAKFYQFHIFRKNLRQKMLKLWKIFYPNFVDIFVSEIRRDRLVFLRLCKIDNTIIDEVPRKTYYTHVFVILNFKFFMIVFIIFFIII